jgi:hypothetical protein
MQTGMVTVPVWGSPSLDLLCPREGALQHCLQHCFKVCSSLQITIKITSESRIPVCFPPCSRGRRSWWLLWRHELHPAAGEGLPGRQLGWPAQQPAGKHTLLIGVVLPQCKG